MAVASVEVSFSSMCFSRAEIHIVGFFFLPGAPGENALVDTHVLDMFGKPYGAHRPTELQNPPATKK